MEKIFLIMFFFVFLSINFGQVNSNSFNLPKKVESAFHKNFPGAKVFNVNNINIDKKKCFKIETIFAQEIVKVIYDLNGKIMVLNKVIDIKKVPGKITKKLKGTYPGSEVMAAHQVLINKKVSYELDTIQGGEEYKVTISDKGKILKRIHIFEKVEEGC